MRIVLGLPWVREGQLHRAVPIRLEQQVGWAAAMPSEHRVARDDESARPDTGGARRRLGPRFQRHGHQSALLSLRMQQETGQSAASGHGRHGRRGCMRVRRAARAGYRDLVSQSRRRRPEGRRATRVGRAGLFSRRQAAGQAVQRPRGLAVFATSGIVERRCPGLSPMSARPCLDDRRLSLRLVSYAGQMSVYGSSGA
jgi:hypothetical protein